MASNRWGSTIPATYAEGTPDPTSPILLSSGSSSSMFLNLSSSSESLSTETDSRGMAISQLIPAGIRHMVGLLVLGVECDIPISCHLFKDMSSINSMKKSHGYFYVNMKSKYNLTTGIPRKFYDWKKRYFFVKINEVSVPDVNREYRTS